MMCLFLLFVFVSALQFVVIKKLNLSEMQTYGIVRKATVGLVQQTACRNGW